MIDTLKPGSHIHFMGICGTAMASLAGLLKERGYKITGSDQNVYPPMSAFLENLGIDIMQGYNASNLESHPDFVVVGNVISKHFPEAQALLDSSIPYASLPETLGQFVIEDRHSLVVAGTHGKTTTTSMLAWVCQQEDIEPGFLVGGIPKNFETSFQNPKGNHFVIEGDEYDTAFFAKKPKFCFYKPKSVILNSIEFDHADIYRDLDHVLEAFHMLMDLIPKDGVLVYRGEDTNIQKVLPRCQAETISFGYEHSDWEAKNIGIERSGLRFDVFFKGKREQELFVPMFGSYNILNALSVYAMAKHLGFQSDLQKSFLSFQGVKRRQELIGEPGGIQVIDDFAHHPTAVGQTIQSFKARKDTGELYVVFEPRSNTSRRKIFQKEYTEALRGADHLFLGRPIQGSKALSKDESIDVDQIAEVLAKDAPVDVFENVETVVSVISQKAKPNDTVLIMSNGGFGGIYQKLLSALEGARHQMVASPR